MLTQRSRRFVAACVAATGLFAAAYANSLRNGFHFDDVHVVETNPFIRDLTNIPRFFTDANAFSSLPQNTVYRPLVTLSLAIDYAIGRGLDPLPFHVTQLLLFAAVGVLIFLLYRRLFEWTPVASRPSPLADFTALFAATLFCVHTANTQPGNYISARSELLSALGVLGAFAMYLFAPRTRRLHLYLLPAALGLFAKNHAVMFAPLLLAYKLLIEHGLSFRDILTRRDCPDRTRALISSIPAFVVLGALLVFVESMGTGAQSYGGGTRWAYLATSAWVWVRYVGLYFLPMGLTADTDLRLFTGFDPRTAAGAALLFLSLAAAWRTSRDESTRPIAFGILWFWIAIAPTSTVVPLAEVTNDHRYFIGFIGLNLAVVWTLVLLAHRAPVATRLLPYAAIAVLVAHAVGTHVRNRVWRDDETLWSDVARKSPTNGRGLMNYGLAQMRRGRLVEARDLFTRALQFNPYYSFLEANLGIVNAAMGDHAKAERHYERAVQLEPAQPVVHRHYSRWLLDQGRGVEALPHAQALVGFAPADLDGKRFLLALYAALGETAALRRLATDAQQVASRDPAIRAYAADSIPFAPGADGWFNLGWSLTQQNRHLDAAQVYRRAVAAEPSNPVAWNNLGWTLGKLGFYDDAVKPLERAIALSPRYQLAKNNLAWVRGELAQGRGLRPK
jgi:Flp pilus assembly protein TadD